MLSQQFLGEMEGNICDKEDQAECLHSRNHTGEIGQEHSWSSALRARIQLRLNHAGSYAAPIRINNILI